MSEFPVESPVEASPEQALVEEPVEITQLEHDRLLFEWRKQQAQNRYREERKPNDRNVLLNDPLLDPVLAQKIREGVRVGFCRYGDLSNEQIKERFRQPLDHLKSSPPFPVLAMPPPFKGILSIDREFYEGMLTQARGTFEVCMEQLKYVMNIGTEQVYHHVKQAEALKDDPEKQTEYQAQWTKADEIHRSLVKINKVFREMHSSSGLTILESFTQPGFLETPSS